MFWEIFWFEFKYRIKCLVIWVYFGIFFVFGVLIVMDGGNGNGLEKVFVNLFF